MTSRIAQPMNYERLWLGLKPPGNPINHSVWFFNASSSSPCKAQCRKSRAIYVWRWRSISSKIPIKISNIIWVNRDMNFEYIAYLFKWKSNIFWFLVAFKLLKIYKYFSHYFNWYFFYWMVTKKFKSKLISLPKNTKQKITDL